MLFKPGGGQIMPLILLPVHETGMSWNLNLWLFLIPNVRDFGLCALKVNKLRRPQLVVQGQGKWNEGSFELTLFT